MDVPAADGRPFAVLRFDLHHPPFRNLHSGRDSKIASRSFPIAPELSRGPKAPWIFFSLTLPVFGSGHPTMSAFQDWERVLHLQPNRKRVGQALTSPDRCVLQVGSFAQGFFMEITDTDNERDKRGREKVGATMGLFCTP